MNTRTIVSNIERSFVDNILHGDEAVQAVITSAKRLASTELRVLGRAAGITSAMCGDGTDVHSVVFAAKCYSGKRWDEFCRLIDSAANNTGN